MAEAHEFTRLLQRWQSAAVLLATFLLTLTYDLSIGILAGCAMAALLSGLSAKFPNRFSAPWK
jgi:SulP family sulfate permease